MTFKKNIAVVFFLPMLLLCSCHVEKYGSDLGSGLASKADTIGHNLVAGLRDELTSPVTQQKLSRFLDSLITNVINNVSTHAGKIEDSLLSPKALRWADSLVTTLTGNHLKTNMEAVQAALVGKTKADVLAMRDGFRELLNEILSDRTRGKIALLRDELLGPRTTAALTRIIDTAVNHIVDSSMNMIAIRLRRDINPIFKDDASFIQRNAIWLLVGIAALAAGIIILVWRNRQKYLRMLTIVAKQVHDIPDQRIYDQVTSKIKSDSVTAGLEPDLRSLLAKNGLINGTTASTK